MAWEVEYTDEWGEWWTALAEAEQDSLAATIGLLEEHGPALPYPYSSGVEASRHDHMRELRIQHRGKPYRILYAFDPRRMAILLIGGNKQGNDRWYATYIPVADRLYDEHLKILDKEIVEKAEQQRKEKSK